jgi:small subunit ribosomal protein S20
MLAFGLGLAFAGLAVPRRAAAPLMVGASEGALRRKNKRIRQNERDRMRNKSRRSQLKTATKKTLNAISEGDLPVAQTLFSQFQKLIDRHATKGLLHKNKAARVKSRIHRKLKSLEPPYEAAVEPAAVEPA